MDRREYEYKQWAARALPFARKIAPLTTPYPKQFDEAEYADMKQDLIDHWCSGEWAAAPYHSGTIRRLMRAMNGQYRGERPLWIHLFLVKIRLEWTAEQLRKDGKL